MLGIPADPWDWVLSPTSICGDADPGVAVMVLVFARLRMPLAPLMFRSTPTNNLETVAVNLPNPERSKVAWAKDLPVVTLCDSLTNTVAPVLVTASTPPTPVIVLYVLNPFCCAGLPGSVLVPATKPLASPPPVNVAPEGMSLECFCEVQ